MSEKSPTRGIFSIILGVLLALMLLFLTFWLPVQKVLLQPEVYQQAIQDQGFYQVYPQLVTGFLTGGASTKLFGGGLGQLTSQLDQETLNKFILGLIPPDWFQEQVNENLDRVFAFLTGSGENLALSVDLGGMKSSLTQEGNLRGLIQILPTCTISDLGKLVSMLGGEGNIPICRFPDEFMGVIYPIIQPILINLVGQVPDQIPLINYSLGSDGTPATVKTIVGFTRNSDSITAAILVLSLILFVVMILVSAPGWKNKLHNSGIVLLAAGCVGLLMDLLLWVGLNSSAASTIHRAASSLPREVVEVVTGIYLQVANNYITVAALVGFVILVCGVILYVVSRTMFKAQSEV